MRRLNMLIVMTAMVFVAAGLAKGNTSERQLRLDRAAVTASGQSSLSVMKGEKSLSKTILPGAQESTVAQLFVAATAEDGKEDGDKNPHSRSRHCPPETGDHHDFNYRDDDKKGGDNQDKDKDKDHHDNCGKGDDGKNP